MQQVKKVADTFTLLRLVLDVILQVLNEFPRSARPEATCAGGHSQVETGYLAWFFLARFGSYVDGY